MAHTTENSNLVWQKVKISLQSQPGAAATAADQYAVKAFRELKSHLAQVKGNPELKFTPFDATNNGSGDGNAAVVASDSAAQLVAIYAKKSTGSTLGYDAISNHATAIQAQKEVLLAGTDAGEPKMAIFPNGLPFATGITYSSVTAYNGTTRSLTVDSSNGFIITQAA